MNIALDEDALAGLKTTSRERKLSTAERIAIYAFHVKGVPAKLIARTFGVRSNAVYYITNWTHTAAHENVKNAYEQMGAEKGLGGNCHRRANQIDQRRHQQASTRKTAQ